MGTAKNLQIKGHNLEGLTVESLLALDSMKESYVIAGQDGLSHPVDGATVIDMPDLGNWASENEVVIVTDYPFRGGPMTLLSAVQSLAKQNAAALCIKTSKNFVVPPKVLDLCNQENFALIKLPLSSIFSNIIYDITSTLLRKKADHFKQLQLCTEELIEALQRPGKIDEKLAGIERILEHKIIFVHKGHGLYFSESTRLFLDQFGDRGVQLIRSRIYKEMEKLLRKKKIAEDSLAEDLQSSHPDSHGFIIPYQDQRMRMILLPVYRLEEEAYSIAVIQDIPLNWSKISALERVGRILTLEYQNMTEIRRLQKKYEDKFIINCLTGKYGSGSDISFSARTHDLYLPTDKTYWIIVVDYFETSEYLQYSSFSSEELSNGHDNIQERWLYTTYAGKLTIILFDEAAELPPQVILASLKAQLSTALNTDRFRMCVSDPGNLSDIPELYQQALTIAEISRICDIQRSLIQEKDLGTLSILFPLRKCKTAGRYVKRFLDPLVQYDKNQRSQLCQTLYTYLMNNSSVKETAEALFTHYNTITYRLERIERILGFSIRSGEAQFNLRLAFELKRLFGKSSEDYQA